MSLAWIYLFAAGALEVCWVMGMKYSHGFTKLGPSIFTIVTLGLSMYALAKAIEVIPIGTAYGIWVGIGAIGAAAVGILLFQEQVTAPRLMFLGMLFVSIIGLKLTAT